jgi:hypothetical protein
MTFYNELYNKYITKYKHFVNISLLIDFIVSYSLSSLIDYLVSYNKNQSYKFL